MIATLIYPLLAQRNLVEYDLGIHQLLIFIFIVALLVIVAKEIFKRKRNLIFKLSFVNKILAIFILVVTVIVVLIFYNTNERFHSLLTKVTSGAKSAKNLVAGIFYDIYGYPADRRMSTASELQEAVNDYRKVRDLAPIIEKYDICRIANQELVDISTLNYTKNYRFVKDIQNPSADIIAGQEIVQAFEFPTLAENVINLYWWRPFSQQKKVLDDPSWRSGCAAISNLQVVFIFSR